MGGTSLTTHPLRNEAQFSSWIEECRQRHTESLRAGEAGPRAANRNCDGGNLIGSDRTRVGCNEADNALTGWTLVREYRTFERGHEAIPQRRMRCNHNLHAHWLRRTFVSTECLGCRRKRE